jgi:hypothetical protein
MSPDGTLILFQPPGDDMTSSFPGSAIDGRSLAVPHWISDYFDRNNQIKRFARSTILSQHNDLGSFFSALSLKRRRAYESDSPYTPRVASTNRSRWMNSKLLNAEGASEASFPSENVRRVSQKDHVKSFAIALLLLVVSFITFVATILVPYPQNVDAFLNSDQPVQSKHVVTSSK